MPTKRDRSESEDARPLETSPMVNYLSVLRDLPDGDTVAYAMVRGALGGTGATLALVYAARSDGVTADLVGTHGVGPREARVYGVVTADMHLPGAEAFRTGVERVMPAEQVAREYPLAAPFFEALPARGDIAFIPLMHRGAPIGFLVIGFTGTLERSWQVRGALDAVAVATALWVIADSHRNGEVRSLANDTPPLEFTVRQRDILIHLREGRSVREIATTLGYSPATIKADVTALSKLLGARGRADLLVKSKRAGL
jgi:DNA-binding CsgD family transcriptional regulator